MPAKQPLVAEDLFSLITVEDPQLSPDGRHLAFVRVTTDRLEDRYRRQIWLLRLDERQPTPRPFTAGKMDLAPRWSPDGRRLAFVSARDGKPQIYLIDVDGGEARALTSQPNGAADPTWSPDGRRLAFLSDVNAEERAREDSGEQDPPPADSLEARQRGERKEQAEKRAADPRVITRLPYRTGTEYYDGRRSHIYVLDVPNGAAEAAGQPRRLTDGELDFNELAWTPDGAALVSTQSREPEHDPWNYRALVSVPVPAKGRRPYRFLSNPGFEYFGAQVSPDGRWIAAGRVPDEGSWGQLRRLALVPAGGGPARELSFDFDRAVGDLRWSADSRWVYFTVGDRGDGHLYRADVRVGRIEPVLRGRQMVLAYSLDQAGDVAYVATTPERPGDVYLARAGRRTGRRLTGFNDAWLAARALAPIEELWHTAPDGRRIQGWLLKPPGWRRGQRVPLVVSMHGGPWVMWGPAMPAMWLEWQLQAARGYAVYFCNPRGSEGYGEEHALTIRNDWGDHVMHDILTGVDAVVAQGFVDERRMALTGGSYAGYMTAWIVSHDQRFACAWAQRGLYNLISFFGTSDIPQLVEREFETMGFDDLEKLWKQSPLAYVRGIRTPLTIEHQDNDWRCPPSEAEQLYAAL
ncbi:MAG: S9 family peptidase, partial [Anaerolineales bacterium]|nr:S9 family peptidase [Anaerolineales bacterium]